MTPNSFLKTPYNWVNHSYLSQLQNRKLNRDTVKKMRSFNHQERDTMRERGTTVVERSISGGVPTKLPRAILVHILNAARSMGQKAHSISI